jgi:hypothetical protein
MVQILRASVVLALLIGPAQDAIAAPVPEVVPIIAICKPSGEDTDILSPGPLVGLSVGVRVNPLFSLHVETDYSRLNFDSPPEFETSGHKTDVQLVPAFHVIFGAYDISLGPTLGLFWMSAETHNLVQSTSISSRGRHFGGRLLIAVAVTKRISVGPIASYARMWESRVCLTQNGGAEGCNEHPRGSDNAGFWSAGLAAQF